MNAEEYADERAGRVDPIVCELIGVPAGLRVLDAGCGDGSYCEWLADKNAEPVGIDRNEDLIRIARIRRRDLEYHVHDFEEPMPFDDDRFDLVLCLDVARFHPSPFKLFKEFARNADRIVLSIEHPLQRESYERDDQTIDWLGEELTDYGHLLEDYVRALLMAGFVIEDLREYDDTAVNKRMIAISVKK